MKNDTSLILLTYKGKILLFMPANDQTFIVYRPWSFIGGMRKTGESFAQTIAREVRREISIDLLSIKYISLFIDNDKRHTVYHSALTDKNVNEIQRTEGKELQFFTISEIEKLPLTSATKNLVYMHKDILQNIAVN